MRYIYMGPFGLYRKIIIPWPSLGKVFSRALASLPHDADVLYLGYSQVGPPVVDLGVGPCGV